MNTPILASLLQNATMLLAIVVIFDLATGRQRLEGRPRRQLLVGLIVGVLGIGLILNAFHLESGIVFDARSVLLAVSGLFLGVIPTTVAMAMTAAYRLWQGGAAAWAGTAVILVSGGLGLAWRHRRRSTLADLSWRELYVFGVVVHVFMLALMLTLPWEIARRVLAGIGLPVLIVYPAATTALGLLLVNRIRRERAIDALAESAARYRTLFEANPHCMWIFDLETLRFLAVNNAAVARYGHTRDEFLQMTLKDIRPPEEVTRLLEDVAQSKDVVQRSGVWRHRTKAGEDILVEIRSHALPWQGRPARLVLAHEVTAQVRARQELEASEERLRLALAAADQGLYDLNVQTGECVVSPEYARLLGHDPAGFRETHAAWRERLHPDDHEPVARAYDDYLAGRRSEYRVEFRQRTRDGHWKWILSLGKLVARSADGRPLRMLGTHTDITRRKQAEEEIRELNATLEHRVRERTAQLEAANQELEAFSYSVSHDLRAPLRAINGFARILTEDHGPRLDDDGRRVLGVVREAALRMDRLIEDLLRFSRLGRQPLQVAPTDMTALAREVYAQLAGAFPERSVEFRLTALPFALADAALLRQVWVNLLDNALKYSRDRPCAEIGVSGSIQNGEAVYVVRDNGAGFEMKYAGKLFGVFQRLHEAGEFEGTGVGLALVQRVVHRHGGRVWAEAELDRGATFFFTLPAAPDVLAPPAAEAAGISPSRNPHEPFIRSANE